jgi:2'-5' RNA ligase
LFIAIELDENFRRTLSAVQAELKKKGGDVRWVRPELMHLTIKFLGEVPDAQVADVGQAVLRAARRAERFELAASQCGCFPQRGPVRVIWAGNEAAPPGLLSCISAVEAELEALGFPREQRPFSPHITLGRVQMDRSRGQLRSAVQSASLEAVSQEVSSIVVMSSVLARTGPTYTVVSRAKFSGKSPDGENL